MKYFLLMIFSLMLALLAQTQVSKTITISAGNLGVFLSSTALNTITILVETSTMDARDFSTIRDRMPSLTEVNLQGASVAAYLGMEGIVYNGVD